MDREPPAAVLRVAGGAARVVRLERVDAAVVLADLAAAAGEREAASRARMTAEQLLVDVDVEGLPEELQDRISA